MAGLRCARSQSRSELRLQVCGAGGAPPKIPRTCRSRQEEGGPGMPRGISVCRVILLIVASLVASPAAAAADQITFDFAVVVDTVWSDVGPFQEFVGTKVAVGDTFTGSYTFDSSARPVVE